MENKNVGYILLGVSILIVIIIFLFNSALRQIVTDTCTMAGHDSCTMDETISQQTYLSLAIVGLLIIVAIILIISKPSERIIIKRVKEKKVNRKIDTSDLKAEEKQVFGIIRENKTIFQADLIEKTGFGKAKITRILDRLEGKGIVERKRRGMTNVVVLKGD